MEDDKGLGFKMKQALLTAGSVIRKMASEGKTIAPPDVQEKRWAICFDCDYLIETSNRCRSCGCFMNLKVPLLAARCSEGKWD